MPSSVKDRFTVDFEYLFFFSKSKKYYFEQQFESYSDSYLKENRPMGVLRQRLYKESKYQKYEYGSNQFKNRRMPPIGEIKKAGGNNPTYSGNTPFYKEQGRNKRTVWTITTKGFKEAHFAVFPPELIETPIKAGCPEFVCRKCGKAREKIFKIEWGKGKGKPYIANRPDGMIFDGRNRPSKKEFTGYTNCNCNVGFEGGVVLDPFIGSGTTGLVALKQRKHFIGFEINSEYIEMANRGLESVQVSLL